MIIVTILTSSVYVIGSWSATQDTEVWNGQVTSKSRVHGAYEDPYDCMCTTDSKGNRSCSTCYETRYTVKWKANTTVGNILFDSKDSSYRSVYNSTAPVAYKRCYVGEPATTTHSYTNYAQAAKDSLFAGNESLANLYKDKIPNQPKVFRSTRCYG